MNRIGMYLAATSLLMSVISCSDDDAIVPTPSPSDDERYLSGGETTVFSNTTKAFSFPAPNLAGAQFDKHLDGDLAFEAEFVSAPAAVNRGLGPIFNNNTCVVCHPADGRGRAPLPGENLVSALVRVSVPGSDPAVPNAPRPVPGFGTQIADKAIFGVLPEASVRVTYTEETHSFADGSVYSLRRPTYILEDPYQPLPSDILLSPRVALPVFGRGLLEALDESTILALADPNDADGDGISGRPNYVWDFINQRQALGRFGWKANQPSLLQQSAAAYNGDIGVTSPVFPLESAAGQPQSDGLSDEPEVDMQILEDVTFYTQTLAVPARRNVDDPRVLRGKKLFADAGCASCHVPSLQTGTLPDVPEVSQQRIQPYTDMLLHDMGEDLADGRPDFEATGSEWRTPPLWGIGLTRLVHDHFDLLHDGRARNLMEAIMWHGGEAEAAREFVRTLSVDDRQALIAFLESL